MSRGMPPGQKLGIAALVTFSVYCFSQARTPPAAPPVQSAPVTTPAPVVLVASPAPSEPPALALGNADYRERDLRAAIVASDAQAKVNAEAQAKQRSVNLLKAKARAKRDHERRLAEDWALVNGQNQMVNAHYEQMAADQRQTNARATTAQYSNNNPTVTRHPLYGSDYGRKRSPRTGGRRHRR